MSEHDVAVALVTGGASGIGAACSRALAARGFRVGIHHFRSVDAATAFLEELPDAFLIDGDLGRVEVCDAIYQTLRANGGRLDVLVNNAGVTHNAPIFTTDLADLDRLLQLNVRGTFQLTKRLSRLMMRRKHGRIINISSVVGSTGNPGQSAYAMTKAAIDAFTRTLARELAPFGVLVNSVAPGLIDTAMSESLSEVVRDAIIARVPLGRVGRPEEVAEVVAFLASSASYITGTTIHVNGGLYGG